MYKQVHRYLELEKLVDTPDFLSRLTLVADLIIQPLNHILFWCSLFFFPSFITRVGYSESPTTFRIILYIVSSVQVFMKCVTSWTNMIEFYHLGTLFLVTHIKHCRTPNPFVIRSSTKSHQLFRYSSLLEYL